MKKTWKERLRPPELPTKPRWWLTVGLLLLSALGLNALCLMIGTLNFSVQRFVTYLRYPLLLWLNFLPVVLFVALCYFLTNRAWLAFLIPAIPTLICAFINYFKVILRGDPFMVEDMFLLGEGVGSMSHYPIVLPLWFFVTVLLLVGGVIVLWRYARGRIPKRLWWVRVTGAVLCLALGAGAWFLWYSDRDLYRSQENYEAFNENKLAEDYAAHGFLYAFLHSVSDALFFEPENYSEAYAAQLLSAYEDVPIPNEQRLNIVVTMLESFSDLSRLPQIEQRLTADPYAPYHALLEECYHGTLISDTIGGGTTNAERAFLTGFTYPQPLFTGNPSSATLTPTATIPPARTRATRGSTAAGTSTAASASGNTTITTTCTRRCSRRSTPTIPMRTMRSSSPSARRPTTTICPARRSSPASSLT